MQPRTDLSSCIHGRLRRTNCLFYCCFWIGIVDVLNAVAVGGTCRFYLSPLPVLLVMLHVDNAVDGHRRANLNALRKRLLCRHLFVRTYLVQVTKLETACARRLCSRKRQQLVNQYGRFRHGKSIVDRVNVAQIATMLLITIACTSSAMMIFRPVRLIPWEFHQLQRMHHVLQIRSQSWNKQTTYMQVATFRMMWFNWISSTAMPRTLKYALWIFLHFLIHISDIHNCMRNHSSQNRWMLPSNILKTTPLGRCGNNHYFGLHTSYQYG